MWRPLPQSAGAPTPALPRLPAVRGALGDVAAPRLVPQRPGAECTAGPPPTSGPRDARCAKAREASTRVRVPGSGHRARSGSQESAIVPGARLSSQRGASLTFWRRRRKAEGRGTCAAGNRRQRWAGLRRRHERGGRTGTGDTLSVAEGAPEMGGTGAGRGAARAVTSGLTRVGGARACAEVAPALTSGRAFSVDKWAGLERGACAFGLGSSAPRNHSSFLQCLRCPVSSPGKAV